MAKALIICTMLLCSTFLITLQRDNDFQAMGVIFFIVSFLLGMVALMKKNEA